MLTQEYVLRAVHEGRRSKCLDNRDFIRLIKFFNSTQWSVFGFVPKDNIEFTPILWTKIEIIEQLVYDTKFGNEKAIGERGISAALMYEVCVMWLWILEDELQHTAYSNYGLNFFKEVLEKFDGQN